MDAQERATFRSEFPRENFPQYYDPITNDIIPNARERLRQGQFPGLFIELVRAELARARQLWPDKITGVMEGHGVILEEFEEFWAEVKAKNDLRDGLAMLKELVQVAAMCMRTAEDAGVIGWAGVLVVRRYADLELCVACGHTKNFHSQATKHSACMVMGCHCHMALIP